MRKSHIGTLLKEFVSANRLGTSKPGGLEAESFSKNSRYAANMRAIGDECQLLWKQIYDTLRRCSPPAQQPVAQSCHTLRQPTALFQQSLAPAPRSTWSTRRAPKTSGVPR